MTLQLTADQIQQAHQTLTQGGAASFWQYLANQGDTYAKSAHSIITNPSGFFGEIVTQSWISTGADLSKFPDVAEGYAGNYLAYIENDNGLLPNAGKIEAAYRAALENNHVPVDAAIDSTMHIGVWTSFLGLEPSRQTGETAYPDRALLDQVTQFVRAGYATATGEHTYFYDKATGHWFYELKDVNGNYVQFENASAAVECRLSWWIRAGQCQPLGALVSDLQSSYQTAKVIDPLVLDLDGDGVETISKSAGIHFDHDGNHFAETTGWAGKDDGLLVWDRNGNGQIDNGSELFGTNTLLANGSKATNGFAALAELDSNGEGKIDALDSAFAQLRVWKDTNGNGQVDDGELLTLDAAGIKSLGTSFVSQSVTDAQGNQHVQAGQYIRTDGGTGAMEDLAFAVDTARTIDCDTVTVGADVAALPDLQGFGNVHSLHQAMARDASGHLALLVQDFAACTDTAARHALLDTIVWAWTGADQYAVDSRGAYIDGHQLYALEAFLGQSFIRNGSSNPGNGSIAAPLIQAYGELSQTLYSQLMAQTHFKSLYDGIGVTWNAATSSFDLDVSATIVALQAKYDEDPASGAARLFEFRQSLKAEGAFGQETLSALQSHGSTTGSVFALYLAAMGYHALNGTAANDTLSGAGGENNWLIGNDGNDTINGADKDDLLSGGAGNDTLNGGYGNDTYMFNLGDGADTVTDNDSAAGNIDKLQFGAGINANEIQLSRSGNDLTLTVNTSDKVTLSGYFYSWTSRIEAIAFADGTTWDLAAVANKLTYNGTAGNDYMNGITGYANRINGLDGNDSLYGQDKDDVLDGGAGNDAISGGAGNDLLKGGVGNDTLSGGAGNDIFKFLTPNEGTDSISDFTSGADVIQVIGSAFGLTPGAGVTLLSGASTPLASGTSAQFLYNTTTGALYFDQDGQGANYDAIQIATLTGQKTLLASDIVVASA